MIYLSFLIIIWNLHLMEKFLQFAFTVLNYTRTNRFVLLDHGQVSRRKSVAPFKCPNPIRGWTKCIHHVSFIYRPELDFFIFKVNKYLELRCYIMALQELCPVPFRCVDEINQGMDPDNEVVSNLFSKNSAWKKVKHAKKQALYEKFHC